MKGIILEDNYEIIKLLKQFVSEYPGDFELAGFATNVEEGKGLIENTKPEVLILDIRLGESYVFDLLESINPEYLRNTTILFISAYFEPDYIHEALRFAAVDYLLKPISQKEFFAALDKAAIAHQQKNVISVIDNLKKELEKVKLATFGFRLMVVKTDGKIRKIDHNSVMYLELRDKLVHIITPTETIASQKSLKNYDELLSQFPNFFRISKTIMVNLDYVSSLDRHNKALMMQNGDRIDCSRRRFGHMLKLLDIG